MYLKGELAAVDAAEEAADMSAGITATDEPAEGEGGAADSEAGGGDSEAVAAVVLSRSGRRAAFGGRGEEAPEADAAGESAAAGDGGAEGNTRAGLLMHYSAKR